MSSAGARAASLRRSARGRPEGRGGGARPRRGASRAKALERLARAARAAQERAYAPYSSFRVGAAVEAAGRVYEGANVENASYGLTVCAERAAVLSAVLSGERRLDAVAVASFTNPPTPPCGMCLQTLAEFAGPELPVLLVGQDGAAVRTTLGELLPRGFSGAFLK